MESFSKYEAPLDMFYEDMKMFHAHILEFKSTPACGWITKRIILSYANLDLILAGVCGAKRDSTDGTLLKEEALCGETSPFKASSFND